MSTQDPLASLISSPIVVDLAGRTYVIEAKTAAQWLTTLMDPETRQDDIFPGLLPRDQEIQIYDLVDDGVVTDAELKDLAHQILTIASGRPHWEAMRIVAVAYQNWEALGGELALAGVRADQIPLGAWLDAAYLVMLRISGKDQRQMLEAAIKRPPVEEMATAFDEEQEAAHFMAAIQAVRPGS